MKNINLIHIAVKFQTVFTLFMIFSLTSCNGQNNKLLEQKSSILDNQSKALIEFTKVANVIDNDSESYWGYEKADSILSTIDISGENYHENLSKIYSATTYLFYGMSYTRSIYAMMDGDNNSLEELSNTIIKPLSKDEFDYKKLVLNELSSIYSMLNFYKVAGIDMYDEIHTLYQNNSLEMESTFKNYSAENAYRIVSFENKKLNYKNLVGLIFNIYLTNNQNSDESVVENYLQILIKLGEEMDEIPGNNDITVNLTEQEYYNYILKSSEIQKKLFDLFITEIKILKQRNA